MNNVFTTKRTRTVQIGNDFDSWIEPLNDLYISNREFMNLTTKPVDSYRDLIMKELKESHMEGRLLLSPCGRQLKKSPWYDGLNNC